MTQSQLTLDALLLSDINRVIPQASGRKSRFKASNENR